jgi:predicted DsbA family dithiol-disulfide isomerase
MRIDFVSDVACPWCAVGLHALERALERLHGEFAVELRFEPFELNPAMGKDGEDALEHLSRKYGRSREELEQGRRMLVERGAAVGFAFGERKRVWNTFDAHRLIHWATLQGRGREMKHALLRAYHGRGENPGDPDVLVRCAGEAGLDAGAAREVVDSGRFATEVRDREAHFQRLGISAVPSVIVDDRYLIQGAQPPEVFEQALRQIASERAAAGIDGAS